MAKFFSSNSHLIQSRNYFHLSWKVQLCWAFTKFFSPSPITFINLLTDIKWRTYMLLTDLKTVDSLHQDHMKGMHQKSMFFPVLWPPCFLQWWMPLKGYSPPRNNPGWPQKLLVLSCWHWVEPRIHQLATSVVWSVILRSYFLKIMVYLLHPVYKHARRTKFCQISHNSVWLQIGLKTVLICKSSILRGYLVRHLAY